MDFEQSFTLLIGNEGKYKADSSDKGDWTGGEIGRGTLQGTKYGISAASYPDYIIRDINLEAAKAIYLRDFWNKVKADMLPDAIRFDMFDTAVNSGVSRAVKLLQRTIGIKEDGLLGLQTLQAVSKYAFDPQRLDKGFNAYRLLFIASLGKAEWEAYGRGWVVRIANNLLKD
jgi:lysozyme family protein